jgi:CD109 antigen
MRYELAGRKVILYMSDLRSGSAVGLAFKVRSLFPVKAKIPVSRAYAYYDPAVSAESAAGEVMVEG